MVQLWLIKKQKEGNKTMTIELTPAEAEELGNLLTSGLMQKVAPTHLEESLIKKGIVKRGMGGLVVTDLGHHIHYRKGK